MLSFIKVSSSSSEDDLYGRPSYAMISDEKKRKRMISNRESARRSRMKREQHVKDLNDQTMYFSCKRSEITEKIDAMMQRHAAVESENEVLRMQGEELKRRLEMLEELTMQVSCNNSDHTYKKRDQDPQHYEPARYRLRGDSAAVLPGIFMAARAAF